MWLPTPVPEVAFQQWCVVCEPPGALWHFQAVPAARGSLCERTVEGMCFPGARERFSLYHLFVLLAEGLES